MKFEDAEAAEDAAAEYERYREGVRLGEIWAEFGLPKEALGLIPVSQWGNVVEFLDGFPRDNNILGDRYKTCLLRILSAFCGQMLLRERRISGCKPHPVDASS